MKTLLVDLSSVAYPAWHAGADKPIGFMYEAAVSRVRAAARGHDRVVIACDSGRSFRKDIAESYKANRPDHDPTLLEQLRRVQETLEADGFLVVSAPGFEADDIVATYAEWLSARDYDVEVLSSDKDLLATSSLPKVRVRSVQTNALLGPNEVVAKFGVRPDQMRDLLALMGDTSDGVAGVKGVGLKHAARLLSEFGSLGGIIEALDAKDEADNPVVKPPSIHAAISAALKDGSLETSRKLVTLRTDVPIDCSAVLQVREPKPVRPDFGKDMPKEEADVNEDHETDGTAETQRPETPAPSAALAVHDGGRSMVLPPDSRWALEPRSMNGAQWLANQLFESRLFAGYGNNGYGSPEQVLTVILAGRERGLGAVTSLMGMNVIRGKISMGASLMVGLCLAYKAEYFDLVESSAERATYATKRRGSSREVSMTFTIDQAKQLKLYPGKRSDRNPQEPTAWEKDPENMLRHRCSSRLARAAYPDVVANVYTPDELEEA